MNMIGNIVSLVPVIQEMKAFPSPCPSAMPQRSRRNEIIDDLREARDINYELYQGMRDKFIDQVLFGNLPDSPGLYFFLQKAQNTPSFFYIGKSGSKNNQQKFVRERLRKHFITFDYFFFALAFPENIEQYYKECLTFCASGKYSKHLKTYKRQFEAFKLVPFDQIAWIGNESLAIDEIDELETQFIAEFDPPANGSKRQRMELTRSTNLFTMANKFLMRMIEV